MKNKLHASVPKYYFTVMYDLFYSTVSYILTTLISDFPCPICRKMKDKPNSTMNESIEKTEKG